MNRLSRSFSARLSATVLVLTSILFVAAITTVSYFSHKIIAEEATKNAANVLSATALDIDRTLEKIESSVANMQWVVYEHREDTMYLYHITQEVVEQNKEIVGSAIAFIPEYFNGRHFFSPYSYEDSVGHISSKQLGNDAYDYFKMEWFTVAYQSRKPHWSSPYYDEGGGQRLMTTYSIPLMDDQGDVYAILTADIDLYWLNSKINALRPYVNSRAILLTGDGGYVSGTQVELQRIRNIFKAAEELDNKRLGILGEKMTSGDSGMMAIRNERNLAFAVYGPLSNGWSAAIISPYKDVFVHIGRMNLIVILVSVLGLLLMFVLCFHIVRRVTQPITEFSVAALNMAKGNFQTHVPEVTTQDEMRQLHDSFEYMQKSLNRYIQELRETTSAKERYEGELSIARSIQMHMVPTDFPKDDIFSLYALLQPARQVGGDLYDFVVRGDDVYFAIGDVSGKGVPAALFMAVTRSAFRFIGGLGLSLSVLMERINTCLCDGNTMNMFVTLFAGHINLKTGQMSYCNAGHNPLVIIHADGRAEYLRVAPNLAVGVFSGFQYQEGEITLEKGSRLLLYTDGVTEAENAENAQYGEERLLNFAQSIAADDTSEQVIDRLMASVKEFTGDAEQNDDITIMTFSIPK